MSRRRAFRWMAPIWLLGFVALAAAADAADWPCFRGNAQRTALAAENLDFPMRVAWVFEPTHPPAPAYVKSVRLQEEGSWATRRGDRAQQGTYEPATHDYSFYPAIAGGRVFYASSTDEGVHCLDAATGKPLWSFYTEGAIRLAPHVAGDRVYAGSDDGKVYCLSAADGREIWSAGLVPQEAYCIGQNRPISAWPVRGGVVVEDGTVYAGAGMFPQQEVKICSLDAATGRMLTQQSIRYVAAGPAMLDGELLWMPTHRTTPTMIRRETLMPVYPDSGILLSRGASQVFKVAGLTAWGPDEAGLIYMILRPSAPVRSLDKIQREDSFFRVFRRICG